jgi:uncharacterized repeat protein (TIGR01451 family)
MGADRRPARLISLVALFALASAAVLAAAGSADTGSAMTLDKSSTMTAVTAVGEVIPYTYLITNTGSTDLTGISLNDNNTDVPPSCPGTTLAVGTSMTCSGQHTVGFGDFFESDSVDNDAVASSNEAPDAEDSLSIPVERSLCPSNPPKVNVRWHYSANGTSGSWSGTQGATCGATVTLGPQAMEGDLKVAPGTTLKTGYDFTLPGNKQTFNITFTNPQVVFTVRCVSGATPSQPTLTVPMGSATYTAPDSQWYPSGNQQSALVYQGAIAVPDLCFGGKVRFDKGGTFSASLSIS